MAGLLKNIPINDSQRRANDQHQPMVVIMVLAMLFCYMYLFTHIADPLELPRPEYLAKQLGINIDHVFDSSHNVSSTVSIKLSQRYDSNDDERLVFFLVLTVAFLSAYFLPLEYKQPSLIFCSGVALWLLYGPRAMLGLLLTHLIVYLVLHPQRERIRLLVVTALLSASLVLFNNSSEGFDRYVFAIGIGLATVFIYRYVLLPLLDIPRIASALRTLVIQSAIVTVSIGAIIEGYSGDEWSLPLAVLLFFWQWERLIMYHVDYKDGLVPMEIPLSQYLAVFWNPGVIPNWNWGVTIGQGYAYVHNSFLCEDKNKLVVSGLKLWAFALFYLIFWDWGRHFIVDIFADIGIPVYRAYTKDLVRHFVRGGEVTTISVLTTTFLDLCRWTMLWAGVVHFKVGIWRICGYRMDAYINRPWLSTDLATFWSRFTFHYREFLVRAFYYPVFFRYFKRYRNLRILVATMAAAAFGNLIWGHVTERLFYRGMELEHIFYVLGTWPYFVLLGLGITFSQIVLLQHGRKRKPWTRDRWFLKDIISAYLTLQYFALIHIFARPYSNSTVWDLFRLFMLGFGVDIPA